jgi:hypothetical protein
LEGGVKKPLSKLERGWGEVKKAKAKVLVSKTRCQWQMDIEVKVVKQNKTHKNTPSTSLESRKTYFVVAIE